MSLLFSDMSILLGWNIVLGLEAVSGTGWIISRGSMVASRCTFPSDLVSGLLNPRTNPGEACRRDPGDITRDVPQRSRRILRPRAEIKRRQALQKRHCAAFGHPRISIDHDVFPHSSRVRLITEEGQRKSRRMFLTFWYIARWRWPITNSSPSIPIHTTVTCGLPLGL